MSIEELAVNQPEKILKVTIDELTGPQSYQGRELAYKLGLQGKQVNQFAKIFLGICKMFVQRICPWLRSIL